MITFDFDDVGYQKKVRQFAALQRQNLGAVVRDEARLAILECIRRTPPLKPGARPGGKRDGERAVTKDIAKVFPNLKKMYLYTENTHFKKAVDEGDVKVIARILRRSKRFIGAIDQPDPATHQQARDSRGRVRQGAQWRAVTMAEAVEQYAEKVRGMVGYARSGWRKAAERFGAKLEGWVSRHSGAGLVEDRTHATETPVAECGNAVKFAQRYEKDLKIVRFTLGLRKKTLEAKIRRATNKSFLESNV